MIGSDVLRPPGPFDVSAGAYKDWLHLNVLDHTSGSVGLVNVSLHGRPDDPRSRAVGTALVHVPGVGWAGGIEARGMDEAAVGSSSIGLERVALAVDHSRGEVLASARVPEDELVVRLAAVAVAPSIDVRQRSPLGSGWISWYVIPRLDLRGEVTLGSDRVELERASAYHDHNWGRWHWGDDVGWEWGCFMAPPPGPAFVFFVFARTADRSHQHGGEPVILVHAEGRRHAFSGPNVEHELSGLLETTLRRVPGAMAALHQDRASPRLPQTVRIRAADGVDRIEIEFTGRAAAQLIAAEPTFPGYSFIHEIVGDFRYECRLGETEFAGTGLGVFEHVD